MERNFNFAGGWCLALLLALLASVEVASSPVGAPAAACEDMTPHHNDTAPQTSVAPYQLTLSGEAVVGGESVNIVLTSDTGELFRGFFIQARDVATDEIIGTFQTDEWKYVDCDPGVENAVTHPSNVDKTSITVDWVAPADYDGIVVLRATVVQEFYTFWVGIESTPVTVTPARSGVDSLTLKKVKAAYDGCDSVKGCFGYPDGCFDTLDCMVAITYTVAESGYYIEVFGNGDPGLTDIYVAGGLSFDTEMQNTSVMACRSFGNVVDVVMSFNSAQGHHSDILADPLLGLSDITALQADGLLYCGFYREANLEIGGYVFDLDTDVYYLEVAHGNLNGTGDLTEHEHEAVSAEAVSLGGFP